MSRRAREDFILRRRRGRFEGGPLGVFFYFERCNERDCEVPFGTMSMTKYVVEVSWKAVGTYKQPFMVESFKESDAKFLAVGKLFLILKMCYSNRYLSLTYFN